MNLLFGGISGMFATSIVQPIDCMKVQIQVRSEKGIKNISAVNIIKEIYSEKKSLRAFYSGLDCGLLRQATYTSTRLGLFYTYKDYKIKKSGKNPTNFQNTIAAMTAGACGALVGNPADMALVRMQNNLSEVVEKRRNYKNVFNALFTIVKEEGILTLWRGSSSTAIRAMAINFSMLVPFEGMKVFLSDYISDFRYRTLVASMCAGFCASCTALPFDNVKTKMFKMSVGENGKLPYKGVIDCALKTIQKEGITKLWVGFPFFYFLVFPHSIISLNTNEFLRCTFIGKTSV